MAIKKYAVLISAVRAAWPATRPPHSFFKFRAYPLNVLPSGFRFLDGDNPADPLIAREWRNVLPFCPRRRVRNENLSQIRRQTVYRAGGDRFLGHRFHSTPLTISKSARTYYGVTQGRTAFSDNRPSNGTSM
jgi:hypothetical protein